MAEVSLLSLRIQIINSNLFKNGRKTNQLMSSLAVMTKMTKNYPVMQVLGYQGIDTLSNKLITENTNLNFFPKEEIE